MDSVIHLPTTQADWRTFCAYTGLFCLANDRFNVITLFWCIMGLCETEEREREREREKQRNKTNKQSWPVGSSCRRRCAAGGGVALRGRLWPADSAALLPEHAGADGGQREDGRSVRCLARCCRLLRHPAPPHWEDLRRCAGTQRDMRPTENCLRKNSIYVFLVSPQVSSYQKKFLSLYDKTSVLCNCFSLNLYDIFNPRPICAAAWFSILNVLYYCPSFPVN